MRDNVFSYSLIVKDHILCSVFNLLLTYACLHFRNVSTWVIYRSRNLHISESIVFTHMILVSWYSSLQVGYQSTSLISVLKKTVATATQPGSECEGWGVLTAWHVADKRGRISCSETVPDVDRPQTLDLAMMLTFVKPLPPFPY